MTVLVTMAGMGSRFRNHGYQVPKHMIRARGKTLFEWSIESLKNFHEHHIVFACLVDHDVDWIKRMASNFGFPEVTVVTRPSLSLGQAQTAYDALYKVDLNETLWIYNIDTYIENGLFPLDIEGCQGCAHVFRSNNPGMSYVRFDESGQVAEIAEKKVISNWATVGVYGFESADLYRELYQVSYEARSINEVCGERYVAPMYQLLLNLGGGVSAPKLDASYVHVLGTPKEVLDFDPLTRPPCGALV